MRQKNILFAIIALSLSVRATDITFFSTSDLHYGDASAKRDSIPGVMNKLPGKALPAGAGGGVVGTPLGVIICGDLCDATNLVQWAAYSADFGVNGEGKVKFPVYDGYGNHDNWADIVNEIVKRNKVRKNLRAISANGNHYSWDWQDVHFVHLNLCGANLPDYGDPRYAFDFLKSDLQNNVGTSGRPIVIAQHYPPGAANDWNPTPMYDFIKNYNVIAVLVGHWHTPSFFKWNNTIDCFQNGAGREGGDVLVWHITDSTMAVAHTNTTNLGGGATFDLVFKKTIKMGKPPVPVAQASVKDRGPRVTFSISGEQRLFFSMPKSVDRIRIFGLSGKLIATICVSSASVSWDAADQNGIRVSPGSYIAQIIGKESIRHEKFILK